MSRIILMLAFFTIIVSAKEIIFGVAPQQNPKKLIKKWNPIIEYLKKETGITILFQTQRTIPAFEKELNEGKYDIAYMNPYHFVMANEKQNYTAFIRAKRNIVGVLLSKNSKIDFNVKNLKNKTFLFASPNAFATLISKFELKQLYNFDIEKQANIIYVNNHDSIYKGIIRGFGFLGGGIVLTYNNFEDKDKINIVYKTKAYPSHPIAYHPRVNISDVDKIRKALLNMPQRFKSMLNIKDFIVTNNKEFDVIKNIGLK